MNKNKIKFLAAMLIFGSIGIFVRHIPLPASQIVFMRCILGGFLLFLLGLFKGKFSAESRSALKGKGKIMVLAGTALGLNWLFLYEAYQYTSVSLATVLYYLAPIFVVILSPFVLKEKLNLRKIIAIAMAASGLGLIIGISGEGMLSHRGIIYGLLSAVFYATLMLLNQKLKTVDGLLNTIVQVGIAAVIMFVYVMVTFDGFHPIGAVGIASLIILCVVHTSIACYFYFSSVNRLKGQEVAVLSYLDPASALVFSFVFLGEVLSVSQWIGVALIIGSTVLVEVVGQKKERTK